MPVDALDNLGASVLLGVDVFSKSELWTRAATSTRVSVGFVRHMWREVFRFAESEVINRIAYAENLAREAFVEKFGSHIQHTFSRIYGALISDDGDQYTSEDAEMTWVQHFHGHQFYRAREIIGEGEIAAVKLKIAFFSDSFRQNLGGLTGAVTGLHDALVSQGHEVTVFTLPQKAAPYTGERSYSCLLFPFPGYQVPYLTPTLVTGTPKW